MKLSVIATLALAVSSDAYALKLFEDTFFHGKELEITGVLRAQDKTQYYCTPAQYFADSVKKEEKGKTVYEGKNKKDFKAKSLCLRDGPIGTSLFMLRLGTYREQMRQA
jgi:hypothetical protein